MLYNITYLNYTVLATTIISGRVGMGMTTLLTLTAMFGAVRQNVPRVSYVSYLDIWMLTCMIFVFASMIEFTVVHSFHRSQDLYTISWGECIERTMQIVIPCVFVAFNLVYWPLLCFG